MEPSGLRRRERRERDARQQRNEGLKLQDDELARRIGAGDPRAFDALFDRYAAPLIGYLSSMVGERATAEDLLQETMIRVYRNIGRYRERGAFRAWIYQIATNLALTELRRARFRGDLCGEFVSRVPDPREPSAHENLERRETLAAVRAGIASLPDEQRTVVLLRVRREMGIREIARVLRIPEGTVKSRLHYAVRSLRDTILEKETPRTSKE
ncbi:MAG: RNA polymerase sigma factor [Candidatus Eisenbacteria bacterium]